VITVPAGIRVLVATKPVDFRRGADSLAALVREQFKHDPFSGTIYIFRSKRADRLKILTWDGPGLVLFWKRLEHGAFRCRRSVMASCGSLPRSSPHLSTAWTGRGSTPSILRSRDVVSAATF